MKIGIDASRAFDRERTGTEEYSNQLLRHLALLPLDGQQVFLYVKKGTRCDFKLPSNFSLREIGGDFLWTQLHLSWELLTRPVDLLFVPAHTLPLIHPRRSVGVVHGLEFKHCPQCYAPKERMMLELNTRLTLLFARRLIVPSESTRQDLRSCYRVPPEKITVIAHGSDGARAEERQEVPGRCRLLYLGRIEKRKNLERLLEAFDRCLLQMEDEEREQIDFVLAGKNGFGAETIKRRAQLSPFARHIDFLGYVSEEKKAELLRSADLFLFPSLYEGFGLPVLEAMSYGVPVLAARNSALLEVTGEAAELVAADKTEEIAAALLELSRDAGKRAELRQRGYQNLQRFSWKKCAQETWQAISRW